MVWTKIIDVTPSKYNSKDYLVFFKYKNEIVFSIVTHKVLLYLQKNKNTIEHLKINDKIFVVKDKDINSRDIFFIRARGDKNE